MTTTKESQVIKAEVGDNFFEIVDRLFDNSARTVCAELIQNARRAGATRISFTTDYVDDFDGITVKVTDNGSGIDDMADLLRIRGSGWDDGIKRREDPAGMGFFCLCRMKNLLVRSKDSEAYMGHDAEALRGQLEVTVAEIEDRVDGVELHFHWPLMTHSDIRKALDDVGMYAPIMIELDERKIKQQPFAPSVLVGDFENDDVRVFITRRNYGDRLSFNFHGLVVVDDFNDQIDDFSVMVDVKETGKLQMVLPARNAIVQNQFYKDLITDIRRRIFGIISTDAEHSLPFAMWVEAKELGVDMEQASPKLRQRGGSYKTFDLTTDKSNFIMSHSDNRGRFESVSAAMALSGDYALYEVDRKMTGYDWYDALPTITNVTYTEGDRDIGFDSCGVRVGKDLCVRCEVIGINESQLALSTPIIIGRSSYGEDNYPAACQRGHGFIIDPSFGWDEHKFCDYIDSAWRNIYMNDSSKITWDRLRRLDVRKCLTNPGEVLEFAVKAAVKDALDCMGDLDDYVGQSVTLTCTIDDEGIVCIGSV